MSHAVRALISIAILSVTLTTWMWAQTQKIPTPPPDFSRAVDLTNGERVQFQEYDKELMKFSTKAQYVLVPVVVTDKGGNPVPGLKAEDFRLQENGKDQVISSVDEIVPTTAPLIRTVPSKPNEVSNELAIEDSAPRRLIIIAIDMVNTPFLDQLRARQQVIAYLSETLDPANLYQIVTVENNGLRVLHDYTQDSADLVVTLKRIRSRFTPSDRVDSVALKSFGAKQSVLGAGLGTPGATTLGPSAVQYILDPRLDLDEFAAHGSAASERMYSQIVAANAASSTLTAFQQIAQRTSGVPGRKSLIWITGGFPFSIDPATARVSDVVTFGVYEHVMQQLNDEMIAVYPVDARGLLTSNVDATMHVTRVQNAFPGAMLEDTANRQRDIFDTMRSFADLTGGHAYLDTNDTTAAVRSAAQDGSRYYLLSYSLDKNNRHQGFRKLTVKVGGYHVRARKGYYLSRTTLDPLASTRFDVDAALTSPLDYPGVPVRVLLKPPVIDGDKRRVTFSTVMPGKGIMVDNADNNHVFVDVAYMVLTMSGDSAAKKNSSYNLNLNPTQMQQFQTEGLGFGDTIELAPGTYKLRVVVRDNLNGHIGSVLADLHLN